MLRNVLIIVSSLVATMPATAQDALKTLEAFYGACLGYGPSPDRTKAAAVLFKWKPLPHEALIMFAPSQAPDYFEGWIATSEGYPKNTVIAVTKGRLDGRPIRTCSMAVVGVIGKDVEKLLIDRLAPRKVGEKSDGMQETRVYKIITGVQEAEQTVTVSMIAPVNAEPAIILSSMMVDR